MSFERLVLVMRYAGWPEHEILFRIAGVWPPTFRASEREG